MSFGKLRDHRNSILAIQFYVFSLRSKEKTQAHQVSSLRSNEETPTNSQQPFFYSQTGHVLVIYCVYLVSLLAVLRIFLISKELLHQIEIFLVQHFKNIFLLIQ